MASTQAVILFSLFVIILINIQLVSVASHSNFFFDRLKEEKTKRNTGMDEGAAQRTSFPNLVGMTGEEAKQMILKERAGAKVHIVPKVYMR
jgi:hypothetical protein